jgi:hypothetical protein
MGTSSEKRAMRLGGRLQRLTSLSAGMRQDSSRYQGLGRHLCVRLESSRFAKVGKRGSGLDNDGHVLGYVLVGICIRGIGNRGWLGLGSKGDSAEWRRARVLEQWVSTRNGNKRIVRRGPKAFAGHGMGSEKRVVRMTWGMRLPIT